MSAMKKDEIRGGLNALFGEEPAPQNSTTQKVEPAEEHTEDILDSLTDEEMREAVQAYRERKVGRPRKLFGDKAQENYERITTIVNKEKMAKLRYIASKENLSIKDIFEEMMSECIAAYEARCGIIPIYREASKKGSAKNLFKR